MRKIERDKWRHFYVGILMGVVLQASAWWFWPWKITFGVILALVIVIFISYGFELFSKITGKGRYDFMDAVASVIGGALGMALALIFLIFLW